MGASRLRDILGRLRDRPGWDRLRPPRCTGQMTEAARFVCTCGRRVADQAGFTCSFESPWPGLSGYQDPLGLSYVRVAQVVCACNKDLRDERSCRARVDRYRYGVPWEGKTVEGHCSLPLMCIQLMQSPWSPRPPTGTNARECLRKIGVAGLPPNCEGGDPSPRACWPSVKGRPSSTRVLLSTARSRGRWSTQPG